jgi:hypothetical protein
VPVDFQDMPVLPGYWSFATLILFLLFNFIVFRPCNCIFLLNWDFCGGGKSREENLSEILDAILTESESLAYHEM